MDRDLYFEVISNYTLAVMRGGCLLESMFTLLNFLGLCLANIQALSESWWQSHLLDSIAAGMLTYL